MPWSWLMPRLPAVTSKKGPLDVVSSFRVRENHLAWLYSRSCSLRWRLRASGRMICCMARRKEGQTKDKASQHWKAAEEAPHLVLEAPMIHCIHLSITCHAFCSLDSTNFQRFRDMTVYI